MAFKNDVTNIRIKEIYNKTKIRFSVIMMSYLPLILLGYNIIKLPAYSLECSLFAFFLPFFASVHELKRESRGQIAIRELIASKMYRDCNYEKKIKVLSEHNDLYKYNRETWIMYIIYIGIFTLTTSKFYYDVFYDIETNHDLFIMFTIYLYLFPLIIRYAIKKYKSPQSLNKLIEKKYKPSNKKITTSEYVYNSNLFDFSNNPNFSQRNRRKWFSFSGDKKGYHFKNKYSTYELKDFDLQIFELEIYNRKIYNGHTFYAKDKEYFMLYIFKKIDFDKQIKVTNLELELNYDTSIDKPYKIEFIDYFLLDESISILDEIYKKDIVDISSNNNCIYIKKYIAKTPTEAEINDYIENIELYKKFIDTLK